MVEEELNQDWVGQLFSSPPAGSCEELARKLSDNGVASIFTREGSDFFLECSAGYGGASHIYDFLEDMELWKELRRKGHVRLDPESGFLGDRPVWVVVENMSAPGRVLVAELPAWQGDPMGAMLRAALLSMGVHPESFGPLKRLPAWLMSIAEGGSGKNFPLLIQSEPGSGGDLLVEALSQQRCPGYSPLFFSPSGLDSRVQLREMFGDFAGERLGGAMRALPLANTEKAVVIIQEAGDVAIEAQVRILDYFREGGGASQCWIFLSCMDLEKMAAQGDFHKDLYNLLSQNRLIVPPLRAVQDHLPEEIRYLLRVLQKKYRRRIDLSEGAMRSLVEREWPGNYDEMVQVMESSFLLCSGGSITEKDLQLAQGAGQSYLIDDLNLRRRTGQLEQELLMRAYALHGGNQVHMARALGISRGSLQYKLEKYRIGQSDG